MNGKHKKKEPWQDTVIREAVHGVMTEVTAESLYAMLVAGERVFKQGLGIGWHHAMSQVVKSMEEFKEGEDK
jgi:hypothetical protein